MKKSFNKLLFVGALFPQFFDLSSAGPASPFREARDLLARKLSVDLDQHQDRRYRVSKKVEMEPLSLEPCHLEIKFMREHLAYDPGKPLHEGFALSLYTSARGIHSLWISDLSNIEKAIDAAGRVEYRIPEKQMYDCEEEGCSQEAIVTHRVSADSVSVETISHVPGGYYQAQRVTCRFQDDDFLDFDI